MAPVRTAPWKQEKLIAPDFEPTEQYRDLAKDLIVESGHTSLFENNIQ
jgi:hypothetical protein